MDSRSALSEVLDGFELVIAWARKVADGSWRKKNARREKVARERSVGRHEGVNDCGGGRTLRPC